MSFLTVFATFTTLLKVDISPGPECHDNYKTSHTSNIFMNMSAFISCIQIERRKYANCPHSLGGLKSSKTLLLSRFAYI